jgi:hypothetical protein
LAPSPNSSTALWQRSPGVLWAIQDDVTVLLSLDTGQYHSLHGVTGTVWSLLSNQHCATEITRQVAMEYDAVDALPQISTDVDQCLLELQRRQLIRPLLPTASTSDKSKVSTANGLERVERVSPLRLPPSITECVVDLTLTRLALRAFGLRRVLRYVLRRPCVCHAMDERRWLVTAADNIIMATPFCLSRAQCLERSVCLFWLGRRAGIDARLRFGVVSSPFSAHAWVEYRGEAMNDHPEQLSLYRPLSAVESGGL